MICRECNLESRHAQLEAARQDKAGIVNHVVAVEQMRQEQIEAENELHMLLELKEKVQAQDSHALRMLVVHVLAVFFTQSHLLLKQSLHCLQVVLMSLMDTSFST